MDELLNRRLSLHIDKVRYVVDRWRMEYNHYWPHSTLGYKSPLAFVVVCFGYDPATLRLSQDRDIECNARMETCTLYEGMLEA